MTDTAKKVKAKRFNPGTSVLLAQTSDDRHGDVIRAAHQLAKKYGNASQALCEMARDSDIFKDFIGPNAWVNPRSENGQFVAQPKIAKAVSDKDVDLRTLARRSG